MWRQSKDTRAGGSDNVLKESLLRQLSHTVKEVQLHHSQTRETCSTQEGTSSLVIVLEAVFLHALKRSLLESALRSVSVAEDAKPAPTFYEAVMSVTHKDTIARISKLIRVSTDVGRSRAWVRLALNEGAVPSYLSALSADRRLTRFYRPAAFLRDREAMDTAGRLLEGLLPVPFEIPLNSSLLNSWSSEPLLLSGLWAPAVRATVQVAVDVAGSIEDDETCSILTASSSVRSLLTLDEAQAIQIILDTPMPSEEHEPQDFEEEVEKKMDELEVERQEALKRSYSYLVESCSPKVEPVFPSYLEQESDGNEGIKKIEATEEEGFDAEKQDDAADLDEVIARPVLTQRERKLDEEYSKILPSDADIPSERDRLEKLLNSEESSRGEARKEAKRNIEETVLRIPRERGLRAQRFECADCRLSISLNFGPAILCHVTGDYLCENCHKSDLGVVPARIFYNWDHTKYPTGQRAATYLAKISTEPIFDIESINPKLYGAVPEMEEILRIRRHLSLLHVYLSTCKEKAELPVRSYMYETPHMFSLADLTAVPGGVLKAELEKVVAFGKSHVVGCWVCKEKGFICEFCRDPQVIYPFDEGSIYRCSKCKAVYHGNCLSQGKSCPKCKRRKQRELDNKSVEEEAVVVNK